MLTFRSTALKSLLLTLIVFASTLLGTPSTAQAQCSEGWLPGQGVPGVVGTVSSLAILPDGDVIVGGSIGIAGSVEALGIARYNPSTGAWSALGNGLNGSVFSLAVLPGGDVIVGGFFTTAGGVSASNIARYNPSTGAWSALGNGLNGDVNALAVLPGGDVIVGGRFTTAGGAPARCIARYNPTTGVWSALGSGTGSTVNALAVLPGGDVIVGGFFSTAGGVAANNIALYNPTTGAWSALGNGLNGDVNALAVLPGGDVIVGGRFTTAGGVSGRNRIARYNPTTGVWSALGSGVSGPSGTSVSALAVLPAGDVIVGGYFTTAGGVPANSIARVNPTTRVWSALGSVTEASFGALAVLPGGDVIVGGNFFAAGGVAANSVARVNPTTRVWSALASGTNNVVYAMAVLPGGDVIVGGGFSVAGGVAANRIARYNPSTGAWSALGSGVIGDVYAVAVLPGTGGDVIVGGFFTTAGGVSASNIAQYNPTTGVWSALGSGIHEFESVSALAVLPGGDVIVGGRFSSAGGVAANHIAQYNPTTGVWSSLGNGTNNSVYALAVLPGGDVIVGGRFDTAGGVAASRIARYNPTTGVWLALGSGLGGGSFPDVDALAVLPSGDVIVGGGFTTAGGVSANRIARYNPTTGVWLALGSGLGGGSFPDVDALAVLPSGDVIVGGGFTIAGGVLANNLARYYPTTDVWSAVGSGVGVELGVIDTVYALAVAPSGDFFIGGDFLKAGDNVSAYFARYASGGVLRIDGTREPCLYGNPLHVQTTQTEFGDNNLAQVGAANGSELDSMHARIEGGTLYVFFAGNVESNFNKLDIFLDTAPGGQNVLRSNNPSIGAGGPRRLGATATLPGLTFDSGFAADYYLSAVGQPNAVGLYYATLPTAGGGFGFNLGTSIAGGDGTLTGGNTNTLGLRATINNSNIGGVPFGTAAGSGDGVFTGVEIAIPLSSIGVTSTCGSIKVCAFINGFLHDFVSNQVLGSLPPGTANLGEPRNVNFSAIAGDQFVTVPLSAGPPAIAQQPASAETCTGGVVSFSVSASGVSPLSYQWRKGGVPISLATNPSAAFATLTFANVQSGDAGSYDCVITNACGSLTSNPATLTIASPTASVPTSIQACAGLPISLTVTTTGTGPFTYQWRKGATNLTDAGNISGTNTATLTINPAGAGDIASDYTCVVTNICGSVTSNTASIAVIGVRCNAADVAYDNGDALPPLGACDAGASNNGVTEADYNLFFATFFDADLACDIANDDGSPLPPFGIFDTNNGVTEGDYNLFFSIFFDGCSF